MKALHKRRIVGAIVFIMLFSLAIFGATQEYSRLQILQDQQLQSELHLIQQDIEEHVLIPVRSILSLISYIQINPELTRENYKDYLDRVFYDEFQFIRNVATLKDTTIDYVYPIKGNEDALGTDLSQIPSQADAVNYVKNQHEPLITSPIELVQGGTGIVARLPILVEESYWGQIALVFDYEALKTAIGLEDLNEDFNVRIRQVDYQGNKSTLYHTSDETFVPKASHKLSLSFTTWIIEIAPVSPPSYQNSIIILVTGFMLSMVIVMNIRGVLRNRDTLQEAVEDRTEELTRANSTLDELNIDLTKTIEALQSTQEQLILAEKLSALSELVAGVAHEINTPLGIGITLDSYLQEKLSDFEKRYMEGQLRKRDMETYIQESKEAMDLIALNLNRAGDLVNSFKMIASDQFTYEARKINLKDYIDEVIISLSPKLKKSGVQLDVEINPDLNLLTYPGAFSQIITNLVVNSITHGFSEDQAGKVFIRVLEDHDHYTLIYEDNGQGIPEEIQDKIFLPFFSTKRGKRSTGLGLHILHNLITQQLMGSIILDKHYHKGARFIITFKGL